MERYPKIFYPCLLCTILLASHTPARTFKIVASPVPAVFVASTPCSTGTRPVPGIPPGRTGCELIKWELKLSGDGKQIPGTYILDCDYGMPKQGTRGFINGGSHLHREGKWVMVKDK